MRVSANGVNNNNNDNNNNSQNIHAPYTCDPAFFNLYVWDLWFLWLHMMVVLLLGTLTKVNHGFCE